MQSTNCDYASVENNDYICMVVKPSLKCIQQAYNNKIAHMEHPYNKAYLKYRVELHSSSLIKCTTVLYAINL